MSMENKQELFEKAPVWKSYFIISLPVVFSMLVTLIYNMVDTFFCFRDAKCRPGCGRVAMHAAFYADARFGRHLRPWRKLDYFAPFWSKR